MAKPGQIYIYVASFRKEHGQIYSAFTVAELGEMSPSSCYSEKYEIGYKYQCHYQQVKDDLSWELEAKLFYICRHRSRRASEDAGVFAEK